MEQQALQNPQLNNQFNQQFSAPQQGQPDLANLQMDGATLRQIYDESERAKKKSGILLILLLLFLVIGINVLNSIFFRSPEVTKYSILAFLVFFIPTLFTKFNLLQKIIEKWFPYLQEPDDFLRRVRSK